MTRINANAWQTDGSLALEASSHRNLVLIEGGPQYAAPAPVRRHAAEKRPEGRVSIIPALAFAIAVMLAFVLASNLSDLVSQSRITNTLSDLPTETVVVRSGDSLWSIAESRVPSNISVAEGVRWIREQNGLESAQLDAGQTIVVPVSSE